MMATTIIQPIDMVKVRLQLGAVGSPFKVASDIVKNDGVRLDLVLEGSVFLHAREARTTTPRQLAGCIPRHLSSAHAYCPFQGHQRRIT